MIDSVESDAGGVSPDLKKTRRQRAATTGPAKIDRLPPHSIEAEQGVLGCVLLSPGECLGVCIEKFKSGSELFYDLRHRHIYELLVEMYDHREAIDLLTVQQRLKDRNQLEAVGGLSYLSSLPDAVPSSANLSYYADIVREKHLLRRMIQTCTDVVGRVYEHEGEVTGSPHVVLAVAGQFAEHSRRIPRRAELTQADRFGGQAGRRSAVL